MHDNLTNSRGTNRIQHNLENDFSAMNSAIDSRNTGPAGIGMISPPNLPGSR